MVVKTHKRSMRSKRSSKKSKSHSGKKTMKGGMKFGKIFGPKKWKLPKTATWTDPKSHADTNLRPEFIRHLGRKDMKVVGPPSLRIGSDPRTVKKAQSALKFALNHENAMRTVFKQLPDGKKYMNNLTEKTKRIIASRANASTNSEI